MDAVKGESEQPMALAISQPDGSYQLYDSITFRRIPVWVVVKCPGGEAYFAPDQDVLKRRQDYELARHIAKPNKTVANSNAKTSAPRANFAAELFDAVGQNVVIRIREIINE